MISYNHPAYSIVLRDNAQAHWAEIESRYMDELTPYEVLLTPLGPNKFDDFGKQGLLGRAYMFMDAQAPGYHRDQATHGRARRSICFPLPERTQKAENRESSAFCVNADRPEYPANPGRAVA